MNESEISTNFLCEAVYEYDGQKYSYCGSARRIDGEFYCKDKDGFYCRDYAHERCGFAKKAEYTLFDVAL